MLGILLVVLVWVPVVSSSLPVFTDVSVSPSSVGALGKVLLSGSDDEFVESQSFSLSRKRQIFRV